VRTRAIFAAPLLIAIALHVWASGAFGQDAFVLALALAAIPLGGRVSIGKTTRRVLGGLFFVVGAAIGWSHVPELGFGAGTLPRAASLVAVGSLLCAVSRLYARDDWARERATLVLGTIAVGASGATRLGLGYALFAAAYVLLALFALRARDPARARREDLGAGDRLVVAAILVVASVVTYGLARAVPPIYDAVQDGIERKFTMHDMVGFGAGATLGAMREMVQSDVEVLRVATPRGTLAADYLRGAVYDDYRRDGFWSETPFAERLRDVPVEADLAPSGTAVRIRRVAGTPGRYFLPLLSHDVRVTAGQIEVDDLGSALTVGSDHVTEYTFAIGVREQLKPAAPRSTDLRTPRSEKDPLAAIATDWTAGATTSEAQMAAIVAHLSNGYRYSLGSISAQTKDPLLDFLLRSKVGYCTYFATALTMLARASGIPARLVTGYRVAEWSPVAHEYVVREKNAHAWVEAWVGEQWRTYDPTPTQELPQDRDHLTPFGTLFADALVRAERAVSYAIAHVTLTQLGLVLGVLGAMWATVRWLQGRRTARGEDAIDAGADRPLPFFALLASSLERRGVLRDRAEPLELFARRIADLGLDEAARLVTRYAALRYGGLGDRAGLERDVERFVRGTTSSS
jgi:transglutaminase-like putative cysteine protease